MNDNQIENDQNSELIRFIQRHLIGTAVTILVFLVLAGAAIIMWEQEIIDATTWIDQNFGFWGLAALLFVGDSILSPVPPDILMLIISKGPMKANWAIYVLGFGLVSTCAGVNGYFIGRFLSTRKWARNFVAGFHQKNSEVVKKYGFWAVAIGAMTPFPFSITCWSAGFLGLDLKRLIAGSALRIPRFYAYYFAIEYGTRLLDFF